MKNQKIYLLTGAAGFLGSNVCTQLLARGERVRAFVLNDDPAIRYVPADVEICEGNLCNPDDVDRFFTIPDGYQSICIHCASMVTVNPDFNQKLVDVNVGGTENIIAACRAHPECEKLVYVSSTGAIPELPKGRKIHEVDEFDPDKVEGWYSRTKAMATERVLEAARAGLNACVVHPSGILGPNDYAVGETTGTLIRIINGEMPIGMQGSFNLCDVRDLAYGCIAAADRGEQGECYILGNEEVTLKELCEMLHAECGCKKIKFYLPLSLANVIARQAEKQAKKSGEVPLMTTFSVYNLARNNTFDYSKAMVKLGYRTRPYKDTIHDEVEWLRQTGKISSAA